MKLIKTTARLAEICEAFRARPFVTIDTEFMRERTYWSQLCLVQMARPLDEGEEDSDDTAVLIDPLAEGIDLAPLFELCRDPNVVKVFHAARQDLEIFFHMGDLIPAPLFDSQVAAMVCGFGEQVGYETLVRRIAKAEVDKSSRFSDWARRPLTPKQKTYALADVTHLRVIYTHLKKRLEKTGRAHWLAEEMAVLTDPATYAADPDEAWRRVKARSHSPRFLGIVRSLARWREITAQSRDVPRSRILKDDALVEIAGAKPKTVEDLGVLRLVQRDVRKPEVAAEVLAAVAEGLACPTKNLPKPAPPKQRREGSGAVADLLKVFLKARADELGIASKLIAQAADLEAFAGEDDPDIALTRGWRYEVFGADAERIMRGELALSADRSGVKLIETGVAAEADAPA